MLKFNNMNEPELRQLFKNLSDCYADTTEYVEGKAIDGTVIQAMTEDRFIETLKQTKLLIIPVVKKCCNALCDKDAITGSVYCDFCRTI